MRSIFYLLLSSMLMHMSIVNTSYSLGKNGQRKREEERKTKREKEEEQEEERVGVISIT